MDVERRRRENDAPSLASGCSEIGEVAEENSVDSNRPQDSLDLDEWSMERYSPPSRHQRDRKEAEQADGHCSERSSITVTRPSCHGDSVEHFRSAFSGEGVTNTGLAVPRASMDDDASSSSASLASERSSQVVTAEPNEVPDAAEHPVTTTTVEAAPPTKSATLAPRRTEVSMRQSIVRRTASLGGTIMRSRIGHRRVDKTGTVTYKRTPTSQLMHTIQMGIRHSIEAVSSKPERDILVSDFSTVEFVEFPS